MHVKVEVLQKAGDENAIRKNSLLSELVNAQISRKHKSTQLIWFAVYFPEYSEFLYLPRIKEKSVRRKKQYRPASTCKEHEREKRTITVSTSWQYKPFNPR